ncbi:MFS transporter [Saccharothrix obliqua]|uniref:MFS transporter n=1 Tax=Saccharothrix obliqua TaxID=2861747 RepID=UPI001C6053BB|nr:MFS transporter [Saccharothrix obliqua]MBW4721890.1 MFS transporter [Saccharothrix obliqua]
MSARTGQRWALIAVALGVFCVQLDSFALNQALPAIGSASGGGSPDVRWVVSAYLLAVGVLMLGGGALADRLGRRRVLRAGLGLFGVASAVCAVSPGLAVLVAGRVVQGAGGALLMPAGLALLSAVGPPERRGRAVGVALGLGGVATAAGPFAGGVLTDVFGWRSVFWLNVLVVAVAVVAASRAPESRGARGSGPKFSLARNGSFVALTAAGMVANAVTVVFLFVVPLTLHRVWSLDATTAGLVFLPSAALMAVAGPVAGGVAVRRAVPVMAACLTVAASATATLPLMGTLPLYAAVGACAAAALGVANALTLVATQAVVPPERAGGGSGITKAAVTVAAGVGVALTGPVNTGTAVLTTAACGCLVAAVVLVLWWRRRPVV